MLSPSPGLPFSLFLVFFLHSSLLSFVFPYFSTLCFFCNSLPFFSISTCYVFASYLCFRPILTFPLLCLLFFSLYFVLLFSLSLTIPCFLFICLLFSSFYFVPLFSVYFSVSLTIAAFYSLPRLPNSSLHLPQSSLSTSLPHYVPFSLLFSPSLTLPPPQT